GRCLALDLWRGQHTTFRGSMERARVREQCCSARADPREKLGGPDLDDLIQPVVDRIEHRTDARRDVMEERLRADDVRLGAAGRIQSYVVGADADATGLAV